MSKKMLLVPVLAIFWAWAIPALAAEKPPSSAPAKDTATNKGLFRSDRTLEDMKEAEAALKDQWQKDQGRRQQVQGRLIHRPQRLGVEVRPHAAGQG